MSLNGISTFEMNGSEEKREVRITRKEEVANGVYFFELTVVDDAPLPVCQPGAHITVETPAGDNRWYSICSVGEGRKSYCIAVKRESEGRGGSRSMADDTKVGDTLSVSNPGNEFELVDAPGYLLIAGGIGITPIYAMWQHLIAIDHSPFQLIYLTRSPQDTLFLDELSQGDSQRKPIIHHSQSEPGGRFDFWDLLEQPTADHIYCCGSKSLVSDIKDMTGHWPSSQIHFEDFSPVEAVRASDKAFKIRFKSSDEVIEVSESETLLHALRQSGHRVLSSCESGTCGSCKTAYLAGPIDHRDLVLEEDEKHNYLMVCVSRAAGKEIVLDL
jgi:phthalate 4,5-dioxygenase reductase subunit